MDILTSQLAYLPLQHHDPEYEEHFRILLKGFRIPTLGDAEPYYVDSLTEGPITGWFLAEAVDFEKEPRQWRMASPATAEGSANWAPRAESWDSPRDGLALLPAGAPLGLSYPGGYPAIVVAGHSMDKEALLSSPSWAGLVAPTRGGQLKFASAVWDIAGGDLDQSAYAPIISAWHLYQRPDGNGMFGAASPDKYLGIAWQMGIGAGADEPLEGVAGLGMCADFGFGRELFAAASYNGGGPLDCGNPSDKHKIAASGGLRGKAINAVHLSTQSVFMRPDGSGDASQQDGGRYVQCRAGPVHIEAYWRYDSESFHAWRFGAGAGLWRWQASAFIALPPIEDPPPPEPPPKEPKREFINFGGQRPPLKEGSPPAQPVPSPSAPMVGSLIATDRPLPSSVGEIGVRGLVFRDSADFDSYRLGALTPDDRNQTNPLDYEAIKRWRRAAAVMRFDVAANPNAMSEGGRYTNIGAGTAWLLPAEIGLEDVIDGQRNGTTPSVDYSVLGKRWLGFGLGVGLAFGWPNTEAPWDPGRGYQFEYDDVGNYFYLRTRSSIGVATDLWTVLSSGATTIRTSVSSPSVVGTTEIKSPALVATGTGKDAQIIKDPAGSWADVRTQKLQDFDGTLALLEADQVFSGDQEFSGEFAHTGATFGAFGVTPTTQQPSIPSPTGGATQDTVARARIDDIRGVLMALGWIAS